MVKFGNILYRWRGIIGFIAFWIVWYFSRPSWQMIFIGLPLILIGLILRFWASGYIGKESRSKELMVNTLIINGPYRYIRNPLYLGNFFLTLGVLLGLNLPIYFILLIIVLFWIYYAMIIKAEEDFLKERFGEEYLSYWKMTGTIIPINFSKKKLTNENEKYKFRLALKELQTIIILLSIYGLMYLRKVIKI
jgi:protein-S-isoprenylcysteine O-methyltransferase Ste14